MTDLGDAVNQEDPEELTPLEVASALFDEMCQDRHDKGADKYGDVKFLEVDTIEMALEELVDLANYTRYTFMKLWMLRETLPVPEERPEPMGVAAVTNPQVG